MSLYYTVMSGLINNPRLYSTIRVGLVDADTNETIENLYDDATQFCDDIGRAMAEFKTPKYPTNNLMEYFSLPDNKQMKKSIKQKIQLAYPTVCASDKTLYAALDLSMSADLSVEEFKIFAEQIKSQYWDGWGAEFESSNILTRSKDVIYLRLYHPEIEFYTADYFEPNVLQHNNANTGQTPAKAQKDPFNEMMDSLLSEQAKLIRKIADETIAEAVFGANTEEEEIYNELDYEFFEDRLLSLQEIGISLSLEKFSEFLNVHPAVDYSDVHNTGITIHFNNLETLQKLDLLTVESLTPSLTADEIPAQQSPTLN